jgi:hypothetical protein
MQEGQCERVPLGLATLLAAALLWSCSPQTPEPPQACGFGDSPTQDATIACFEDLDANGDAALSAVELDRLPRTRGRLEELDSDGNGTLSPREFQEGINTLAQRSGGKGV